LKGHSHNTAKYAKLIASKLDLPQREVDTIALAAYIHELGLKGVKHRSLMNIDDDDADPEDIFEQSEIPIKLLSAAKVPLDLKPILHSQFEKWNGKGMPDKLAGEDIPIGARILALVEAFEDLTNKFSENNAIEPTEALEVLKKHENQFFDPALVELFLGIVRDDIYIQQMAGDLERILIADTEADFVTLLDLKLANMGFAVTIVRSGQEAIDKAKSDEPTLIISEANLPDMSGFDMIEHVKEQEENADTAFLFLSKNDDSESVNRGFALGAEDYITKPIKVGILCAKINTMMTRLTAEKEKSSPAASGVSGSLSEMGIPDIVQILNAGRKTGRITLEDSGKNCHIDMQEGQVVNASIDDLKGEDAFYQILYWTKGNFSIDSSVEINEVLINMSMDSLMLEGFKRMDEDGKEGSPEDDIALDGSDFF
jgi:response regulator RpfG family c-di-GMP phosphodiesterase